MTVSYTDASGNLKTCSEPKEPLRVLQSLKNIMDPKDENAKELYEWLEHEIINWNKAKDEGADEERLDIIEEVQMFNIIDEINYGYLHPEYYQ